MIFLSASSATLGDSAITLIYMIQSSEGMISAYVVLNASDMAGNK